jgi:hypothetical protein
VAEPPNDPLAPWRDLVAQWEKNVNALANQTMASDEYSSSMHGAMGLTLKLQQSMRDAMTTYLATANLPSRTEVLAIGERLAGVETRLDRITALLERIASAGGGAAPSADPAPPRPPRTKRPPRAEPIPEPGRTG